MGTLLSGCSDFFSEVSRLLGLLSLNSCLAVQQPILVAYIIS